MRVPHLFAALGALAVSAAAYADVNLRVGSGIGCNHATIQAAIDAATPANGITNILIARNQVYVAQQLDIDGKNIRLSGGYADCLQPTPDSTKTVLDGSGGSARSILNVRGSTTIVEIRLLDFENGDEQTDNNSFGGAVDITEGPHASIRVEASRFVNNRAGQGGAISVRNGSSSQTDVHLRLGSGNVILQNAGIHGGGGLYCRGATLDIKGTNNFILQNAAGEDPGQVGYGGGLSAIDCRVEIGGNAFVFDGNTAYGAGGGISAYGSRTVVHLYNIDPFSPQVLSNNFAQTYGGGIDVEQGAKVYAWDMILRGNSARGGGGAVALYDDGANDHSLFVASRYFTAETPGGDPATFDKAFTCAQPESCNRIENNTAESASGVGTDGGAFRISTDGSGYSDVVLAGTRLTLNRGDSVVWLKAFSSFASIANITFNGALIDHNQASGYLVRTSDGRTTVVNSTIAGNVIDAQSFTNRSVECQPGIYLLLFEGNVFWQPGKTIGTAPAAFAPAGCARFNVANDLSGLAPADQMLSLVADPRFVDIANDDLHLQATSPAIDFSPARTDAVTRDGGARVIDDPSAPNAYGAQDAGAYERPVLSDRIFADGFEDV